MRKMRVDLHIHSNDSDSSRSPEEIVSMAKCRNVGVISVCDHATIGAYDRLSRLCRSENIKCILGVELGASWYDEGAHVLAYHFDRDNRQMKELIQNQYQTIECEYIVYNMIKDYPQMSLEEYRQFEYPKDKGGWKYLYYAVAKGAVQTYEEGNSTIFGKYSTPNHLSGPGEYNLSELCSIVTQAGGVPVLAHPGDLYSGDPDAFVRCLDEVAECGIGGIECYYPSHSDDFTKLCVEFCKRNDLRITGGCDCHGDFDKSEGYTIGALDISLEMLGLRGIL